MHISELIFFSYGMVLLLYNAVVSICLLTLFVWLGFHKPGPNQMKIPHALTVVEEKGLLCTADRENGRILCYRIEDGSYSTELSSPYMGTRLYSVAYSSISGELTV